MPRAEAILDLKWKQVDFERKVIDFNPVVPRLGMKNRARARMGPKLLAALPSAKEAALSDYVIEFAGGKVESVKKGCRCSGPARLPGGRLAACAAPRGGDLDAASPGTMERDYHFSAVPHRDLDASPRSNHS